MARKPQRTSADVIGLEEAEKARADDDAIIDEAKYRFNRAQLWEGDFLKLYSEDVKFANADSDNGWQWPDNIKRDRDLQNRPCLTINKTKMHVLLLANEARMNAPSAKVKPVGDKVSYDAAEIWEGLVRHIEYKSDAQSVYMQAKQSQLEGGIGYWQIQPDYEDDRSFNQELRIIPLDTECTFLDCDIKRVDGSDAMWGFIFQEYNRKEWYRLFPDIPIPPPSSKILNERADDWIRRDGVRIAEYYRILLEEENLLYLEDDEENVWVGLEKDIPQQYREQLPEYRIGNIGKDFKERKVMNRTLQWFKIGGDTILDRRDGSSRDKPNLKGQYIPIVRLVGRERHIDGNLYRSGLVRGLKDAQRMYNYNTSGEVEVVALQSKTPWIVAAAAIEGNESAWKNANRTNAAYLTYKHVDDDGNPLEAPHRMDPPVPAQGFLEGLRIAAAEMEMASGQYQGQVQAQQQAIERSPRAIDARERMGDLANYDFTWNELQAIRYTAIILIDLMPYYYDTERVTKIRAKDGTVSEITIKPGLEDAYQRLGPDNKEANEVKVLFNPKIGKYAVEADIGPAYQTQREEAWKQFKELMKSWPEGMNLMGDLGFLAADWPMADKIAERLRRQIEATAPYLLDDSKTGPLVLKLQEDLRNSQSMLSEVTEKYAEARMKLKGKDELRDLEVYQAETDRLGTEAAAAKDLAEIGDGHGLKKLIQQQIAQMLGFNLSEIEEANKAAIEEKEAENEPAGASEGA